MLSVEDILQSILTLSEEKFEDVWFNEVEYAKCNRSLFHSIRVVALSDMLQINMTGSPQDTDMFLCTSNWVADTEIYRPMLQ